jgi:hypothetical protein
LGSVGSDGGRAGTGGQEGGTSNPLWGGGGTNCTCDSAPGLNTPHEGAEVDRSIQSCGGGWTKLTTELGWVPLSVEAFAIRFASSGSSLHPLSSSILPLWRAQSTCMTLECAIPWRILGKWGSILPWQVEQVARESAFGATMCHAFGSSLEAPGSLGGGSFEIRWPLEAPAPSEPTRARLEAILGLQTMGRGGCALAPRMFFLGW